MGGSIQYNYRILALYRKLVKDMMEAQLPDGLVPDIAPEFVPFAGGFRDSPEWGSAAVILPWYLNEWYGDRETMAVAYPMMKRYVDYLATKAEGHILSHGLGDWYDLGPDFPGEAQLTPKALTATAIYYRDLDLLSKMAALLKKTGDAGVLRRRAEDVRKAFNTKFYDTAAKVYRRGARRRSPCRSTSAWSMRVTGRRSSPISSGPSATAAARSRPATSVSITSSRPSRRAAPPTSSTR